MLLGRTDIVNAVNLALLETCLGREEEDFHREAVKLPSWPSGRVSKPGFAGWPGAPMRALTAGVG